MSTKPTKKPAGLATFAPKAAAAAAPPVEAHGTPTARQRGQGETVALTVRMPRADWARLHQLAVAEGVSLQALALSGLSKVFAEHGLPPIAS